MRKQLSSCDQIELNQRERSKSLRDAQETNDYLMEQMRLQSQQKDELEEQILQLKMQADNKQATIQDQVRMLTRSVAYI